MGNSQDSITAHFRRTAMACAAAAILLAFAPWSQADIYRYVDEDGVAHYTNVPTRGAYSLYMREGSASAQVSGPSNRYDQIIREAAAIHGVDFALIKAVINVESGFDPRAVSRAGARGLMQIMPENYQALGISDPHNPRQSILGGAQYLRQMLNRFNGKTSLALAAYNAGPNAVEKYKSIPPYTETQVYVRRVMQEFSRFRQIHSDTGFKWRLER